MSIAEASKWTVDLVGHEDTEVSDIEATHYEVVEERMVDGFPIEPRLKFFNGTHIVAEYRLSQIQGWRKQ